jgi:hypothetical protein
VYPLVRDPPADGIAVTVTCRVPTTSRHPNWVACQVTDTELAAAYSGNVSFDAHRNDPDFG